MDANRFDALTSRIPHRLRPPLLAAGLLWLGAWSHVTPELANAKKKKKCKKPCGECRRCKKGKCKPKPNGTACGPGTCQGGTCDCPTDCCSDQDCGGGAVCLANGSCALICTAQEDCPEGCQCSHPSVEGPTRCILSDPGQCEFLPECSSTVNCLEGRQCQQTSCPGNPNRCVPLCGV
jgi:hypothetical protein